MIGSIFYTFSFAGFFNCEEWGEERGSLGRFVFIFGAH